MISGKITKKIVKPGSWGGTIIFIVQTSAGEKMVSALENKIPEDLKYVLRALVEGMYAEFETVENVSKTDGKVYLNIISAVPVTQMRDEVAPTVPLGEHGPRPVHPDGQPGTPKESGDTRTRSMCVAYSKDLVVAGKIELDKLKAVAEELYQYVMTGE